MNKTAGIQITIAALLLALMTISCSAPGGADSSGADPSGQTQEPSNGWDVDPETGLVAGLTFDENIDENSPVSLTGAVWVPGVSESGLEFNGYDHYVSVPDDPTLTLTVEGTISAWVNAYTINPWAGILHKGEQPDFSDESYSLQFYGSGGVPTLFLYGEAGGGMEVRGTAGLTTDRWYHLAATWDTDEVRLYVDGVMVNSKVNTIGLIKDSDGQMIVGAQLPVEYNGTYGHVGFDGIIDQVDVFDHAFSSEEILIAFQQLDPNG